MTEADAAAGGKQQQQQPPLTKRQRRKHVNPSNTWPQQPNIQSPAARGKASLRVAGLLTPKSKNPSTLDPQLDLHSPEVRFGRFLGAPEQRKRHLAVTNLQSYLRQRCDIHSTHGISEMDLLKLWKGLWYTLYLADKVPVQQELSKRLAKLVWCVAGTQEEDEYAAQMYLDMCNQQEENDVVMEEIVNTLDESDEEEGSDEEEDSDEERSGAVEQQETVESDGSDDDETEQQLQDEDEIPDELIQHCRGAHLAALFVKTFFRTIQREWGKMDKHRIDKFYTLVRLMLHEIFSYMAARHWNRGIIFLFNDIIRDEVLFQVPNGLRCHLIDITIAELAQVNKKAPMPLTEATIMDCLDPYFALAQNSDDNMVHGRVMENIFAKFLEEYSVLSETENKEAMDQVHVGTISKFLFELGSDVDTQERYRKPLYDMHKKYMKRLKKVGKDVELDVDSADDNEEEYGADAIEGEEAANKKEMEEVKSKKKKRKAAEETEEEIIGAQADSRKDRKKRKKTKREGESPHEESVVEQAPVIHEPVEEEARSEKKKDKKKKKKKKKQKSSNSSEEGSLGSKGEDEIITITYSEQKKAAEDIAEQSPKKKKKKAAKTPERTPTAKSELTSEEKRVKFGKVNHSKSYKASMKALKTVKHTPSKSPEHGILRSKIASPVLKSSSGKSRKKAVDYF